MNKIFKIVCPFLCFFLLFGCTSEDIKTTKNPYKEIGEEQIKVVNAPHQKQWISIPKTNYPRLNEFIRSYVAKSSKTFKKQCVSQDAQLNIHYHSYVKDHRYVSLQLFIDTLVSELHQDVKCIVFDTKTNKQLSFEDFFNQEQWPRLAKMVQKKLKKQNFGEWKQQDLETRTSAALENYEQFLLKKEGVVFVFPPKKAHQKTIEVTIDYIDLQHAFDFKMNKESKPVVLSYEELLYQPIINIDPNQPMVALTFDDGPSKKHSSRLLDALIKYNAHATFFVLGDHILSNKNLIQRMILEGHEIGNHTYMHKQLTKLSNEQVLNEINQTNQLLKQIGAYPCKCIRPPYGSVNQNIRMLLKNYHLVLWDIDTKDWQHKNVEKSIDIVMRQVKDGDIILMHDLYKTSVDAAIRLIPMLQAKGYQLVRVSDLYKYRGNK